MGQKGVSFTTKLTVKDCADVFRTAGEAARGAKAKLLEASAKVAGHGDRIGYYTPTFDSPFAAVDGVPDFAIGLNILKFNAGVQGNGTPVHMYVDDCGDTRSVQLVSNHSLLEGARAARLIRGFLEQFQRADPTLNITDRNI